jgi:hypothetical protein
LPKAFEEERLRFVFDDSWSVIKYDDHLKKRLDWLTPRILVVDLKRGGSPEGLLVSNLPGAGQAR